MTMTRRSLLQLLGITSTVLALPSAVEPLDAEPTECLSETTRLEHFIRSWGIKPAHLARESGYSRQHLLRIRFGRMLPSLLCIAGLTLAARRLIHRRVTPIDLFTNDTIASAKAFCNRTTLELRMAGLASQVMNREFEARASNMLGQSIEKSGKSDVGLAIRYYQHALQVVPKSVPIAATYQTNLGSALVRMGRLREAEPLLQPALAGARAAEFLTNAYLFAAQLRRAQGRYEEAMDFAHKALEEGQNSLYVVWEVKANLGEMLIECGRVEEGIDALRESIDLIEARRVLTTSSGIIRARYFATRQWIYSSLLDVLVDQKRPDEAFAVAERMKARSLDDAWNEDDKIHLSADEQSTERALNQRLVDLNRTVVASTGAAERDARKQLRAARLEVEQFNVNMALRHGGNLAARAGSDPVDVVARWQGPPLIEYAVLPHSLVAFVVRNGRVVVRRISNRAEIERTAEHLARQMERRDINYEADARRLYGALIAPVADLLPEGSALDIVPDRFLWHVPFEVLIAPDRTFFSDRHAIAYAPSMIMLDSARQRRPDRPATHSLLAFGDPRTGSSTTTNARYRNLSLGSLPDAVNEVRTLSTLYGSARSTVLTGSQATETAFRQLVGDYRIVHLATHGVVDDESPLYSALVLATAPNDPNDGLLEMREMSGLDVHAELFVLSGCDTARGELYPGEGVIGMSWALLMAGCPRTVVSQWKATSGSTSELMIEFHRRLLADDTTAEALRKARIALRRHPAYRHPFYWAPFIVVGDGMARIR